METGALIERLLVALAIGLLIGIERGWHERDDPEGSRAAGVRTHALAALLGGVLAAVSSGLGPGGSIVVGLGFLAYAVSIAAFRYRETGHEGTFGFTTVVAAMLAFGLGAFAVVGDQVAAAAVAISVTGLLASKRFLHDWLRRITWTELRSGLLLLAMTFVLLPLLPDRAVDPWQALNPYRLWLMTIAIAGISFAGYAAVRVGGASVGTLFTGIAGGIVSSTAVTVTMSRLGRTYPERMDLMMSGVVLASATMMARVLVIVALFNAELLRYLAAPILAAGLVLAATGLVLFGRSRSKGRDGEAMDLRNPFDLIVVLQFGVLLAAILLASRLAYVWLGEAGVLALALASGIADVDAITLSMSRLAGSELAAATAALAVGLAVASNMVSKTVLAFVSGGMQAGQRFLFASCLAFLAGAIATAISWMYV